MIHVKVTLIDLYDFSQTKLTIPCTLTNDINPDHEYEIISMSPETALLDSDDVWKINGILDEINAGNPDMTLEYLEVLSRAANSDIFDPEFVRRVCEDEFMFYDLTDCNYGLTRRGNAAKHLLTQEKVPFDKEVDQFTMNILGSTEVQDYIDWESIWRQYLTMGFQLIEEDFGNQSRAYLVFW